MSKSRYTQSTVIDGKYFSVPSLPRLSAGLKNVDLLAGVPYIDHTFKYGERLDQLAAIYMGDEQYWWIIALVNNIMWPFSSGGLVPGTKLKVPRDAVDVLDKIM